MRAFVLLALATLGLVGPLCGCRSIHGRYIEPTRLSHGQDVGGIPVRIDRPRWLKLTYKTQRQLVYGMKANDTFDTTGKVTARTTELTVLSDASVPKIDYELMSVAELYAVDFERPASGSSNHSLTYEDALGHPKSLSQNIDDNTMTQVMENLPKLGVKFGADAPQPVGAQKAEDSLKSVLMPEETQRIEIYDLFDIAKCIFRPVFVRTLEAPGCAPQCSPCHPAAVGPCRTGG